MVCDTSESEGLLDNKKDLLSRDSDINPIERVTSNNWLEQARIVRQKTACASDCAMLLLTLLLVFLCFLSYSICKNCLFALLIFCAALCPFFHSFNLPLWIAIILLTISGWSFTTGALSISWKSS